MFETIMHNHSPVSAVKVLANSVKNVCKEFNFRAPTLRLTKHFVNIQKKLSGY